MSTNEPNGWSSYQLMVLSKLEEIGQDIKDLQREQGRQGIDIAMLKVKAGLWGAAAGLVPFGLYVAYAMLGGSS